MRRHGTRAWLGEPLVHFLALSALIFVLFAWVEEDEEADLEPALIVSAEDIHDLAEQWTAVWGRPPTEGELGKMVEDRIREEVLFREAMAMELDQDDVILRRRMVQKMEFLFEDVARLAAPTEPELAAYHRDHADRYRRPARRSFVHVYFNPDRHGPRLVADAQEALRQLRSEDPPPVQELGDRFLHPGEYHEQSQADVSERFGDEFARDVFALPSLRWEGPIESGYGLHLVRVTLREDARSSPLEEVRDRVHQDLVMERRRAANQQMYQTMRDRYRIRVDEEAIRAVLNVPENRE